MYKKGLDEILSVKKRKLKRIMHADIRVKGFTR